MCTSAQAGSGLGASARSACSLLRTHPALACPTAFQCGRRCAQTAAWQVQDGPAAGQPGGGAGLRFRDLPAARHQVAYPAGPPCSQPRRSVMGQ